MISAITPTLNRWAGWLGQRESTLLLLLMVQLGVTFGLISAWQARPTPQASGGASRGAEVAVCGPIEVAFAPSTDLRSLNRWLINYNASIVLGPNESGAFELKVPGQNVATVRQSLGAMAESVQANPLCPATP